MERYSGAPSPHEDTKHRHPKGSQASITGKDTLGIKHGIWRRYKELCDEGILAREKVRYIREPVTAVAAIDEDAAEEALELIEVEHKPLKRAIAIVAGYGFLEDLPMDEGKILNPNLVDHKLIRACDIPKQRS